MKNYFPIFTIVTVLIIASFMLASLAHSDEPYSESMDLVAPHGQSYNAYQRKWMNEAWKMSHDKEFMYMLKAENDKLNHDRRHDPSANIVGVDWGFCGMNDYYHADIVNDPRFMNDPLWQLEKCYEKYKGGTKFHSLARLKNEPIFSSGVESNFIFF